MQVQLNNQIEFSGIMSYKIDSVYDPTEQISIDQEDEEFKMDTDLQDFKPPRRVRVLSF